jgi:hypothetical protein
MPKRYHEPIGRSCWKLKPPKLAFVAIARKLLLLLPKGKTMNGKLNPLVREPPVEHAPE